MNISNREALELIEEIHAKLDRQEWDSDTPVEIAELMEAYDLEVRPPSERKAWTAGGMDYLAEHIGDDKQTRIAVWADRVHPSFTGVQFIRENRGTLDDDRSGTFFLRGHIGFSLDQRLDVAIEKYERIRK